MAIKSEGIRSNIIVTSVLYFFIFILIQKFIYNSYHLHCLLMMFIGSKAKNILSKMENLVK